MRTYTILILGVLAGLAANPESTIAGRDAATIRSEYIQASLEDAPVVSWLQSLPSVGREFVRFLLNPHAFAADWVANPSTRPSPWTVMASSLTIVAFLYAVYFAVFRSTPLGRLFPVAPAQEGEATAQKTESTPRIVGFGTKEITVGRSLDGEIRSHGVSHSFGFGMQFPEARSKGLQAPQLMVLSLGITHMVVANEIPANLAAKSAQTLFLITFGLVAATSSYPCAWLLGTTSTFGDAFVFTISIFTFCLLFWSLLVLIAVLFVRDLLRIDPLKRVESIRTPRQFAVGCVLTLLWLTIVFLPMARSIYISYKAFYSVSHEQMVLVIVSSALLSVFAAPVIFVPIYYLWIKARAILDAVM